MDGQADDQWLTMDWEQSQAKEDVGSLAGGVLTALRERE